MTTPAKFEVGKIYSTGEGRDYVWRFRVIARTAKFITISEVVNGYEPDPPKRVGVKIGFRDHEFALPLGSYSMAPVLSSERPWRNDALYGLGLTAVAL